MARTNTRAHEIEIAGAGGLKIEVHEIEGRNQARLVVPGMNPEHMPCIGAGLNAKTCLRDVKTFLTQALSEVDDAIEAL